MSALVLGALASAARRPELAAFERLAGHCWAGKSPDGKPDTHCFEPVFGGALLRDRHEVPASPPYRGETIYHWDRATRRIDYTYWDSLGDVYRGSAHPVEGGVDFSFGEDAPDMIRWRWTPPGYTVANGARPPIVFVRK